MILNLTSLSRRPLIRAIVSFEGRIGCGVSRKLVLGTPNTFYGQHKNNDNSAM
jgi:hypothetical protein